MPETNAKKRIRPKFPSFTSPNYTQVPDALFDLLLPELTGAELKVLLYIIRRTFGFKREADDISLSQMLNGIRKRDGTVLDRGVGLSKKSLLQALRDLEEMNLIVRERRLSEEAGNQPTNYRLNVHTEAPGVESTPPLGEKVPQGGGEKSTPSPWGKNSPTQETVLQETVRQHTVEQDTEDSTRFDGYANLRHNGTCPVFSKQRDKIADSRGEGRERSGTGEMTAVGAIINHRRTSNRRDAPVTPEDGRETARNGRGDPEHQRMPYEATGRPRRGRPPKLSPYLEDLVDRYSAELHDDDHAPQNRGQAARLWKASGRSETTFGQALIEAKAITLEHDVHKRARVGGEFGLRNKMPYFFVVLRDLLDLKEADGEADLT